MTQMNDQLRQELTELLADHLREQFVAPEYPGIRQLQWLAVAETVMDFMYGGGDEQEPSDAVADDNRVSDLYRCRCSKCGGPGCPDVVDLEFDDRRLMELTQEQVYSMYGLLGVMPVDRPDAYGLDPTRPSGESGPLPGSVNEETSPSPQPPGSGDDRS